MKLKSFLVGASIIGTGVVIVIMLERLLLM